MLRIYSEDQKKSAIALLQKLQPIIYDIVETRSVLIKLSGLEYMNDNPHEVDILYGHVTESDGGNRLFKLCQYIRTALYDAGLVADLEKELKVDRI